MRLRDLITTVLVLVATTAFAAETEAIPREMLAFINAERNDAKLPPLALDESLAAVARAHSKDMLSKNFFAHESPTTGTPADRLAAAKVAVQTLGENIAMGLSTAICHRNLMNSPGHRANILGEYTNCGIGAVKAANGMLYVTQLFATFPPVNDFTKLKKDIAEKITERRTRESKPPLATNDELDELAEKYAKAMAKAGKSLSPQSLQNDIRARRVSFKTAGMASVRTWNPIEVCESDEFSILKRGQIGIGLAKNTEHKKLGYGSIWTVIIFTNE